MKKSLATSTLLILFLSATAQEKQLTILYTNDLHAHVEPQRIARISATRTLGGFANIATLVKKEKAANPHTLYFDAGDYFTGPYISSLTNGQAVIDIMNYLSLDAACIGNHEFDHGWKNVPFQLGKAKFPVLNGNIFLKGKDELLWNHPYIILTVNGIRVGVIGLHGKFAFYDTIAEEMIQGVEVRDEETLLRQYVADLKDKTDLLVLLIHEGIPGRQSSEGTADVSRNLQKDIDLAQHVPGIDVIVTGHAHQGTPQPLVSNGTLIVSTDALGLEVGKLEITYDPRTDKIVRHKNTLNYLYDDEVPDDAATAGAIAQWTNRLKAITQERISETDSPLTRSYSEASPMGNLVTDAMLNYRPEADLALANSGGLREDIEAGPITMANLISAFPFPNTLVEVQLKGSDLLALFEHGATLSNGMLQVSEGVAVRYDPKKPMGHRVVSCSIKGVPINPTKLYQVLTSNFLADGGDGFSAFRHAVTAKRTSTEVLQTIISYLRLYDKYEPVKEERVKKI
jgi:5'-nucleotidase